MSEILHLSDFMCYCDDEGKRRCDELMARVAGAIPEGDKVFENQIVSYVVYALDRSLGNGFRGSIDSIGADMWCGVSATLEREEDSGASEVHAKIYVQCDFVEHGFARVLELAQEEAAKFKAKG